MTNVEQFKEFGDKASYHYADDTATEWYLGDGCVNSALMVYDSSSVVEQIVMREVAKKFLWASKFTDMRPE